MLKRTITELPKYKGRKGNIMSRNNYNFEKRAYGLLDITFCVPETICPVAYRHGLVARQSRKLRRTIWDAAYDAVSHRFGYGVSDSIDFNIFLGWTGLTVSYLPGYADEEDTWEIKLPIVKLKDCLRGYKRPRRSAKKMYTKVYNAVLEQLK